MTQLRLATLAKVSRATVVRFESNSDDIQLSSALRILGVLDMVARKLEGNLLLRFEGTPADRRIVATFAPYLGPGGSMEQKRFGSLENLASFLDELRIAPEIQRRTVAELEASERATIPNVLLSMSELQAHWPVQFRSGEAGDQRAD